MKRTTLHILMTDYRLDSRVRNETTSLYDFGYEVLVFCLSGKGLSSFELRENIAIDRFGFGANRLFMYLTSYFLMLYKSIFTKIDVVHAHDLTALPIAYAITKLKGAKLVYDSHELWSESHHKDHPAFIIKCFEAFERFLGRRCDAVIGVSDGISSYLKTYLNVKKVVTIRNIPSYRHAGEYDLFREEFHISEESMIFLYQGLISQSRGVDMLYRAAIDVCAQSQASFVFMGDGPYAAELSENIKERHAGQIYYKPSVDQDELLKYTKSADVGVHAIRNTCLNHDLCLPNKLFEYVGSGIPVLVTGLREMDKFVNYYQVGSTFLDGDVDDLVNKALSIQRNKDSYASLKKNAEKTSDVVTWNNEAKILGQLYKEIIG